MSVPPCAFTATERPQKPLQIPLIPHVFEFTPEQWGPFYFERGTGQVAKKKAWYYYTPVSEFEGSDKTWWSRNVVNICQINPQ